MLKNPTAEAKYLVEGRIFPINGKLRLVRKFGDVWIIAAVTPIDYTHIYIYLCVSMGAYVPQPHFCQKAQAVSSPFLPCGFQGLELMPSSLEVPLPVEPSPLPNVLFFTIRLKTFSNVTPPLDD